MTSRLRPILAVTLTLASCVVAAAQDFAIDWYTVDGGGTTLTTGGEFDLAGTIGQHDAGPAASMSGGDFELTGGFWTVAGAQNACAQPGDMNLDGEVDGDDVQFFVDCLLGTGAPNCVCADLDGGGVSLSDVALFVSALLAE